MAPELEAQVRELIDRKDIYHVLTTYCRALDRCDVDLMKSVYWEDGYDDHGIFSGNAQEFAEFIIKEIQKLFEVTMHAIMNVHMEVDGDVACTEAYLFAYHRVRGDQDQVEKLFGSRYMSGFDWKKVAGVPHVFLYGGRYIDRFERRDGIWKIKRRQVCMDWNHNEISTAIWDQGIFAELTMRGIHGHEDPVFLNRTDEVL